MKNKILSILLSLAVAVGLWAYVITVADPEYEQTYSNVKVELQNDNILDERGLTIVRKTEYVTLRLKGNRTTLVGIKSDDLTVTANVANISQPGEYSDMAYTVKLRGNALPSAITVQKQNPEYVTLSVEKEMSKEVEIRVSITGSVPEGFEADTDNPVFQPETIAISGPESRVSKVAYALIDETIDIEGAEETITGEYTYYLCDKDGNPVDSKGIVANIEKINVQIPVVQVKELKLELKVTEGGGLTKDDVLLDPGTIQVSGPKAILDELGDTLVIGEGLDLAKLNKNETIASIPIELPENVVNRSGITEVAVTVNFGDLTQKTITVTKFMAEHVPSGMTPDIVTKQLTVTLRGPKAQVDAVTETDLTVTVNLADAQAGNVTRPAVITVSSTYGDVVPVGTYYIAVTLYKN